MILDFKVTSVPSFLLLSLIVHHLSNVNCQYGNNGYGGNGVYGNNDYTFLYNQLGTQQGIVGNLFVALCGEKEKSHFSGGKVN